jgi:hypothetical protein
MDGGVEVTGGVVLGGDVVTGGVVLGGDVAGALELLAWISTAR